MTARFFAALLAVPLIAAAPAAPPELAQVQRYLQSVRSMTADFQQTDARGRTIGGTLLLKRPGRIRFQYQKGVPLLVVGDGKALTMIDYQVKQVSRWPIGNTPLALLLDPSKDVSRYATVAPSTDPSELLVSGSDPKHREYGSIVVGFRRTPDTPGGLTLEGWTVTDAQNNRTTVRLANQAINVPIDDARFRWTDPRPQGPRG